MDVLNGDKFELGPYIVLPKHNKLVVDGNECKVEPKIMAVLCYLIANKGEDISRDKIAEALWPNTVTGLEVVTRAIFELRKILKDDPKKPIYIETIARKGYCFIYENSNFNESSYNKNSAKQSGRRPSNQLIKALVTIVFIVSLFFIYQWLSGATTKAVTLPLKMTFLTDIDVFADSPAISPDGKYVLFTQKTHFKETNNQLILLNIASQKQTVINDGASYKSPIWLDKSKYWYYVRCDKTASCEVIKHNIDSGEKTSIYQVPQLILSLVVSNNSQQLFFSLLLDNSIQIRQVDLKRPNSAPIIITPPEKSNTRLLLAHDEKSLFIATTVSDGLSHLYQYDIEKQNYQLVSDQFSRLYGLSLKDDKTLWIVGELHGQKGLWSLGVASQEITTVATSLPDHTPMLVTSQINLNRLIYKNITRTINIESIGNLGISKISNANSSLIDLNAMYSPNAKTLYFASNRNGLYDIWKLKDGAVTMVTNIKANMIERPILSKQGDTLAFIARTENNNEITIVDIVNKIVKKKILLSNKVFLLSWSNDKKFIYFSLFEAGQYNIYKLNTLSSKQEKILINAGAIAQESQDGQYLYYGDMLNGQLMRRSKLGQVDVMFKFPVNDRAGIMPHRLKVIGDSFYYIAKQEKKTVLKHYSFTNKTLQTHYELPDDIYVTDIALGESIAVIYDRFSKMNSKLIQLY